MHLWDMKEARAEALNRAEALLTKVEAAKRDMTAQEKTLFETYIAEAEKLRVSIDPIESRPSSLSAMVRTHGPQILMGGGSATDRTYSPEGGSITGLTTPNGEHPIASEYRRNFAGWMNNALTAIGGGLAPSMSATAPTGTISIGTGSGLDSIAITVPTEVLNYLPSYFALDSFGLAGATTFYTNDTRPLVKPILSAGSADAVYAEAAAPGTSQPFGTSGFTFNGTKYGRLVLATYESLMNTELPLQGAIMDELLASLANTLTTATTTAFVAALAAASSTLEVGAGGSGGSVYTSMIDLRHAVPTRFDLPTNKWMLSRATLSQIRNTRATTSGIPMFDPNSNLILGREFVLNDNLDTTSGAGVGFVAYGSFADGVWLRRTPVQTRVFLELYAQNGSVGFRTQQWADAHFLAELAGAAQAPSFQPIYYTNIVSES